MKLDEGHFTLETMVQVIKLINFIKILKIYIQPSTSNQANIRSLTTPPAQNLLPNTTFIKVSNIRYYQISMVSSSINIIVYSCGYEVVKILLYHCYLCKRYLQIYSIFYLENI